MGKKVSYLGPQGTFSELAVRKYLQGKDHVSIPYKSIAAVFKSVMIGETDWGVLPMENSCEGTVNQTIDLLANGYPDETKAKDNDQNEIKIIGEIILPINHSLLTKQNVSLADIECVISHPQALAQCRKYLAKNLPHAELIEVASTAEAVKQVSQAVKPCAAIAMADIAKDNGLVVKEKNINDYPNNETRFIVISKEETDCTQNCKTSLLVNVLNKPGALYKILKEFSLRGINLTKIESRPAKTKMGEYLFFIDLDGHYLESKIDDAIKEINNITHPVKVLGSYPAADVGSPKRKSLFTPNLENLRKEVDIIDEQIVELLGRRTQLVEKIGTFKTSKETVQDPEREEWILEKLSRLAEQKGFSPEVTVKIYKILFKHFVDLQQRKK